MEQSRFLVLCGFILIAGAPSGWALPALQIFIDGGDYDCMTETWVTYARTFDLWVIGDVASYGQIHDVKIAVAYYTEEKGTGSLSFTPKTTPRLLDPSTPSLPTFEFESVDGQVPIMSSGRELPSAGVYRSGVTFSQYGVGNLTMADSPIGDFCGAFPDEFPSMGQINVYEVTVTGYSAVHFDTFNHVPAADRSQFGPFSHDGGYEVPEPVSLVFLGIPLAGYAAYRRGKRRKR